MPKKTVCLILLASLFVSTWSVSVRIPRVNAWSGETIYIYADGSVYPTSAPIHQNGDIYALTDNITTTGDGIIIERNSTTLDGNEYTIQGSSSGNGIEMSKTSYVTVKNANIQGFYIGIFAPQSEYDVISGNAIAQNSYLGIWLDRSSNDNITCNNIQQNAAYGIWLTSSSDDNIYHNSFVNNPSQVYTDSINTWDAGYPSGGNYWSDYIGSDYFSGPYQNITGSDGIGDTNYTINANNQDRYPFISVVMPTGGAVGISGYKLVFKETMNNALGSPAIIDYHWSFSVDKWDGTQWVAAGISGSSAPVVGYVIPGLTTVDLPYYVYVLSPSTVKWGDWIRISYTFHWTYSSTDYSTDYVAKVHVHPSDFAGAASVTFPLLGADGTVGTKDLHVLGVQWGLSSVGANPTSDVARADINGDGSVGTKDLHILGVEWGQTWTNTSPPS